MGAIAASGGARLDWRLLSDPAFLANPYPTLRRLREQARVQYDAESGVWFVLGHAEASRILKAPEMGRDTRRWKGGWYSDDYRREDPIGWRLFSIVQAQMINSDPPDHGRLRGVYEPAFRSQMMAGLEAMIRAEAERLLDALPESTFGEAAFGEAALGEAALGETALGDGAAVDMIAAYAAPLPLRVLCNLFGIPQEMDAAIGRWSASLIRLGDILMTPEQKQEALDAATRFRAFLGEHIAARGEGDGDSLTDMAIRAHRAGTTDENEMLTDLVSMLIAGHETTVTLIGNGLLLLLRNPEQLARLRGDRALIRPALEEFMRVEPGGNMILRVALEDYEVAGTTIPAGAPVIGLVGAANRDPARFERPDELDVGRRPNPHLTFGGGLHSCIGAPLARLEGRIAFELLLDRFAGLELAGTPVWRLDRLNARGLAELPVRLTPA